MKYKFQKGGRVEVHNTRGAHSGPRRCAEIISGNGHTYSVRYDRGPSVERVPRKVIRPCPPMVRKPSSLRPGDAIEVFDNSSWKTAVVSMVVGGGYYYVRLLGSSRDYRAHMSELRLRQSWRDDECPVIGKDSEKHTDDMMNWLPKEGIFFSRQNIKVKKHLGDGHFPFENCNDFKELHRDLLRSMKRRRSDINMCSGAGIKVRAVEKEGTCQRLVAMHTPRLQEKIDAVASPRKMLGGKYMHASLNNRTSKISEMDTRKIPNAANLFYFEPNLEPSDTKSTSSSVGSCGTRNSPYEPNHPINDSVEDYGSYSEDAETFHGSGSEPLPPTRKAVAEEVHRLELHAYRTTLVALHASGPISWEQEALMTNLRLTLNISTDEHLLELRNLVAVENNGPLR